MMSGDERESSAEIDPSRQLPEDSSLRVSKRLQIKRETAKKPTRSDFVYGIENEVLSEDEEGSGDINQTKRKRTGSNSSFDEGPKGPNYVSGKKKKVFDYDAAIAELRQSKTKDGSSFSSTRSAKSSYGSSSSYFSKYTAKMVSQGLRSNALGSASGGKPSNHIAIMKQNIDLKYDNERLSRENKLLRTRVNVILDLLVKRTAQLKLLKMTCLEKNVHLAKPENS